MKKRWQVKVTKTKRLPLSKVERFLDSPEGAELLDRIRQSQNPPKPKRRMRRSG